MYHMAQSSIRVLTHERLRVDAGAPAADPDTRGFT